jgi:hypothetical protein
MFYCSDKHLRQHARVLGHADECARMAQQLERRQVGDLAIRNSRSGSTLCYVP